MGDAGLAAMAPKLQHLTSLCLQASQHWEHCCILVALGLDMPLLLPPLFCRAACSTAGSDSVQLRVCAAISCRQCPPAVCALPLFLLQGMGEVTDAGVAHLACLRALEDLELQFAW